MKKINSVLVIFMIICSLILLTYRISVGIYSRVSTDLAIFLVLLIPKFVKKYINVNDIDILFFYIFIFVADFLGCVCNLYKYVSWFDTFAHLLSGIYTFYVGLRILIICGKYDDTNVLFNILFSLGILFSFACIWEIFEFSMDNLFNLNLQHAKDTGIIDTMSDIISCTIGGIIISLSYFINIKLLGSKGKIWKKLLK